MSKAVKAWFGQHFALDRMSTPGDYGTFESNVEHDEVRRDLQRTNTTFPRAITLSWTLARAFAMNEAYSAHVFSKRRTPSMSSSQVSYNSTSVGSLSTASDPLDTFALLRKQEEATGTASTSSGSRDRTSAANYFRFLADGASSLHLDFRSIVINIAVFVALCLILCTMVLGFGLLCLVMLVGLNINTIHKWLPSGVYITGLYISGGTSAIFMIATILYYFDHQEEKCTYGRAAWGVLKAIGQYVLAIGFVMLGTATVFRVLDKIHLGM